MIWMKKCLFIALVSLGIASVSAVEPDCAPAGSPGTPESISEIIEVIASNPDDQCSLTNIREDVFPIPVMMGFFTSSTPVVPGGQCTGVISGDGFCHLKISNIIDAKTARTTIDTNDEGNGFDITVDHRGEARCHLTACHFEVPERRIDFKIKKENVFDAQKRVTAIRCDPPNCTAYVLGLSTTVLVRKNASGSLETSMIVNTSLTEYQSGSWTSRNPESVVPNDITINGSHSLKRCEEPYLERREDLYQKGERIRN